MMTNGYDPTAPDQWQPVLIRGMHPVTGKSHLVISMHGSAFRVDAIAMFK